MIERKPSSPFEGIQLHDGTIFPGFVHNVMNAAINRFVQWTYGRVTLMPGAHKVLNIGEPCAIVAEIGLVNTKAWIERIDVDERGVEVHWTTKRRAWI